MVKKIFDILPPEKKEIREPEPKPERKSEIKISLPKTSSKIKWGLVLALIVLVSIGIFSDFILLGKAKIEIWPETEILTFKTKLTLDKEVEEPNFSAKVIPAEIFEEEKSISENFLSSGKFLKEIKAEGIIRVYNNYSTSSQILVANTRFISADGKLFRSIERVIIPGREEKEGKLIPGYIDIKVRADQPGSEYNIGPTTFSIPGFAGTPKYTAFYGKSFQPMITGLKEEVPQITQKDLDQAQKTLKEKVIADCEAALKNKIPMEFVLLKNEGEEGLKIEIIEATSSAKIGEELQNFNFQVKVKCKSLGVKIIEIENFVKNFILDQIPENKKVHWESLKFNYSFETINLDLTKITLVLEMEIKIYTDIDQEALKKSLAEKSLKEAQWFLENQTQIIRIEIVLRPFWLKKIPERIEKIDIELRLD